jgi:membrane fusion protein (multidrug efflux system)
MESSKAPVHRSLAIPVGLAAGVAIVLAIGGLLVVRAESRVNKVALAASPKAVTAVAGRGTLYRETQTYVGTLRPWVEASVGPQFISAYIDTVLVRPGAAVKRGEVVATLDCRNESASSMAVAAEARAVEARQKAMADESARLQTLLDGGFVSPNEAEQKAAQTEAELAQLGAERAKLAVTGLSVNDCVLRAPFDGEVAVRSMDPGAFVRPGMAIVSVVDRSTVRMTFDVPENAFEAVAPKGHVSIHALATDRSMDGVIARRSPAADPETRTIHVEVDLDNARRELAVNTTGEVRIQVGAPKPATAVPLGAASISGARATLFVVDQGVAKKRTYTSLGEDATTLYLEPALAAGTLVVTEGRALLADGDPVMATVSPAEPSLTSTASAATPAASARAPEVTP